MKKYSADTLTQAQRRLARHGHARGRLRGARRAAGARRVGVRARRGQDRRAVARPTAAGTCSRWTSVRPEAVRAVRPGAQLHHPRSWASSARRTSTRTSSTAGSASSASRRTRRRSRTSSRRRRARARCSRRRRTPGPPRQRIAAYRKLLDEYPDSDVSPQAQFMIGFIHSEELKNYDEAEKAFRELLQRYPKSELAASAQWMVDHMRTEEAPATSSSADSSRPAPHEVRGQGRRPASREGRRGRGSTGSSSSTRPSRTSSCCAKPRASASCRSGSARRGAGDPPDARRRAVPAPAHARPAGARRRGAARPRCTRVVITDLRENTFYATVIVAARQRGAVDRRAPVATRSRWRCAPRRRSS